MFKQKLSRFSIFYALCTTFFAIIFLGVAGDFYLPLERIKGQNFEISLPEASSNASFCLTTDSQSLTILGTEFFRIVQGDKTLNSKYDGNSSELLLEDATGCWKITRSSPMRIRFVQSEEKDIKFIKHEVTKEMEIAVLICFIAILLLVTSVILIVLGISTSFNPE
jgi:hypothetical protein